MTAHFQTVDEYIEAQPPGDLVKRVLALVVERNARQTADGGGK